MTMECKMPYQPGSLTATMLGKYMSQHELRSVTSWPVLPNVWSVEHCALCAGYICMFQTLPLGPCWSSWFKYKSTALWIPVFPKMNSFLGVIAQCNEFGVIATLSMTEPSKFVLLHDWAKDYTLSFVNERWTRVRLPRVRFYYKWYIHPLSFVRGNSWRNEELSIGRPYGACTMIVDSRSRQRRSIDASILGASLSYPAAFTVVAHQKISCPDSQILASLQWKGLKPSTMASTSCSISMQATVAKLPT